MARSGVLATGNSRAAEWNRRSDTIATMSDQDQVDAFVRHRDAVLQTVLSGPESASSAPASSGTAESVPRQHPSSSSPPAPSGPKASDTIAALLNGETPQSSGGGRESGTDAGDRAAARLRSAAQSGAKETEPEPERAERVPPARSTDPLQKIMATVRSPKGALALGGVLAVVIVLVLVTTSGGQGNDGDAVRVVTAAAAAQPSQTQKPSESLTGSSVIEVKSAESHCPAGSTPGMDAFSGQADKAWSCVRAYEVDGQVLTIDLGKKYEVDSIGLVPGWDSIGSDGSDQWNKFRTVSRVSYTFDDSDVTTYTQQTMNQRSLVVTEISPPVEASKIVLTILESKGDPAINTTAVSSIVVTGQ